MSIAEIEETYYGRDEAAAIVHMHPRTLTLKAQRGEIDYVRSGSKNLYPASGIAAYLRNGTRKAAPKPPRNPKHRRNSK